MAKTRPSAVGLIHYEPDRSFRGYTLFCGGHPIHAHLIDMDGRVVHRWSHPDGIAYAKLLENGHLLGRAAPSEHVEGQKGLNGQGPSVFELDWAGNVVWEYQDDWLHHDMTRLRNGNTVVIQWRPLPEGLAEKVEGGCRGEHDDEPMLGDVLMELDGRGEVVREWRAWEHFDPKADPICPLDHRKEWTHANSIAETADGDWIASFRRIDTVALIDPESGDIKWRLGPGVLAHQHDAKILPNGRLLVFDNGAHRKAGAGEFSRVVEIDRESEEIAWSYVDDPPFGFFTFMAGGAERLPNGNTLICQSQVGRLIEVTHRREIVWEYVNPLFVYNARLGGRMNIVFKVHRYGPEHPALEGRDLDPERYANLNRLFAEG